MVLEVKLEDISVRTKEVDELMMKATYLQQVWLNQVMCFQVTPLTALKFAELAARAGLPKGVINILPGSGSEIHIGTGFLIKHHMSLIFMNDSMRAVQLLLSL